MANRILVSYEEFKETIQDFDTQSNALQDAINQTENMLNDLDVNWDSNSAKAYREKLRTKLQDYKKAQQKVERYKEAVQEIQTKYEENEADIGQKVNALEADTIFAK